MSGDALQVILDKFCTYHSVPCQYIPIGLFHKFPELMESLIDFPVWRQALFGVPLGGLTLFACANDCAFSVYGDTAEDTCLSVRLCFLPVNIEQYLKCTSHCLNILIE